jgi:hypothetical protein
MDAQLDSVLAPDLRQKYGKCLILEKVSDNSEILMKYKRDDPHAPTSPENFAEAIRNFDRHVCHEAFLSSLLGILPQPDTVCERVTMSY